MIKAEIAFDISFLMFPPLSPAVISKAKRTFYSSHLLKTRGNIQLSAADDIIDRHELQLQYMLHSMRTGAGKYEIVQRITRMWHGLLWNYRNANNQNVIMRDHAVADQYYTSSIADYLGSSTRSQRLFCIQDTFGFTSKGDAPGQRLDEQRRVLKYLATMGHDDSRRLRLEPTSVHPELVSDAVNFTHQNAIYPGYHFLEETSKTRFDRGLPGSQRLRAVTFSGDSSEQERRTSLMMCQHREIICQLHLMSINAPRWPCLPPLPKSWMIEKWYKWQKDTRDILPIDQAYEFMVHTSESRQQWMVNQGRLPRMLHMTAQLKQSRIFETAYIPSSSDDPRRQIRLSAIPRSLGVSQPDNLERPPSKRPRRVSRKVNHQADKEGWGPTLAQPNARQTPNGDHGWGVQALTVPRFSALPPEP